jgi:hypothetical protein
MVLIFPARAEAYNWRTKAKRRKRIKVKTREAQPNQNYIRDGDDPDLGRGVHSHLCLWHALLYRKQYALFAIPRVFRSCGGYRLSGRLTESQALAGGGGVMKKLTVVLMLSTLAFSQEPELRKERWGMTQNEVIRAEKAAPVRRSQNILVYRGRELGTPVQVMFGFTEGKLVSISYAADLPVKNPEHIFLTWCLELTKRYGQGLLYLN